MSRQCALFVLFEDICNDVSHVVVTTPMHLCVCGGTSNLGNRLYMCVRICRWMRFAQFDLRVPAHTRRHTKLRKRVDVSTGG